MLPGSSELYRIHAVTMYLYSLWIGLPPTIINCLPKSLDVDLPPQAGTILSCLVLIDKAERTTTAHWTVEGVQVPTTVSHLPTTNGTSSMLNASTSVDAVLNMLRGREDICKLAISNSCGTSEHLLMVSFGRDLTSGLHLCRQDWDNHLWLCSTLITCCCVQQY